MIMLTEETLQDYQEYLICEEKTEITIAKYMRDIHAFKVYLANRTIDLFMQGFCTSFILDRVFYLPFNAYYQAYYSSLYKTLYLRSLDMRWFKCIERLDRVFYYMLKRRIKKHENIYGRIRLNCRSRDYHYDLCISRHANWNIVKRWCENNGG